MPAFLKECSFLNTMSVRIKSRRLAPRMLFQSFLIVAQPSMDGVLSVLRNFDS